MNDRPHPGLLPQENEKRAPAFGDAEASGGRAVFPAKKDETVFTRGASELSSDAQNFSLSPGERVRVRAGVKTIFSSALFFLLAFVSPLRAQDTITNVMSPVVSYQYYDSFGEDTNATVVSPTVSYQFYDALGQTTNSPIVSPVVSYQYFDSLDAGSVQYINSPSVSYYYQFLDAPPLTIIPTNRTPTSAEITLSSFFILPSQLQVFQNNAFASIGAFVDTNAMTIVLTHGWIPLNPLTFNLTPVFTPNGVEDWPTAMAAQLHAQVPNANIMAWNWESAAKSPLSNPKQAGSQTPQQGIGLGQALQNILGSNYSKPIHFIGHSFGTLVNAYAANYLQGTNFACEAVSPTPWPSTNMQMTLFDEAEVGANVNFTLNSQDLADLASANANLLIASPYYHPLPKQFAWADNYVSAVGLLQAAAANVILTNGFPANAPDPYHWFMELGAFHGYPQKWYAETIETDISAMGSLWSFERGGWFSQAPSAGSVYLQSGSEWNLTPTNWNYGTSLLAARFQEYRGGVIASVSNQVPGLVTVNGSVNGQVILNDQIVGALPAVEAFFLSFFTSANGSTHQNNVRSFGIRANDQNGGANVPAYAWMPLVIPKNAITLSFDYIIQGNWQSDSLAAAFNGTNVLLIAGNVIQTNVTFSSGSIDVSNFAGQTNEFFIGIVGGTSTNAQLTVMNLAFSISSPPLLQAQASGNNYVLTWPLSAADYVLQTTTNLADPNSWVTLTNVPAIVNLQNTITNLPADGARFYRLKQ